MAITPFTRFIFPAVPCADGDAVELSIIRTPNGTTPYPYGGDGNAAHTVQMTLSDFEPISIGTIELMKHDPDGDICVPSCDFLLNDKLYLKGVSNSVQVSYDFTASKTSLMDEIFSDDTARYDLYLTNFTGPVGSPTKEVYFKGAIDLTQISKAHLMVAGEFTTHAERIQAVSFKAVSAIGDLKGKTAQDLVTQIVTGGVSPQYQFSNVVLNPGQTNVAKLYNASSANAGEALNYTWTHSTTFPRTLSLAHLPQLLTWIAASTLCNFTGGATFDSNMQFDLYGQNYSSANTGYWPLTKRATSWSNVYVCLQFLLGMPITDNPTNSSVPSGNYQDLFVQWPCSFARTDTLDKLVTWLCLQTGTYVDYQIDTSGNFTLQLVGRRSQNRTLPTNFVLMDGSTEEPITVGKSSVIMQMQGDNMQVLCGPNANDAVTLTIPWRCHKWGTPVGNTSTSPPGYHATDFMELWWDRNLAPGDQGLAVTVEKKESGNYFDTNAAWQNPTDKGWIGGAMLYYQYTGGGSFYGPSTVNAPASGATVYAAFAAILPKGFTLPTDEFLVSAAGGEGYFNPLTAYAKFYFQELVGNRLTLKQKFSGCKGDDGKIQSVKPDMHMSTFIRGQQRTFLAHRVAIDRVAATTEITWIEVPATYPDAALAVSVIQQNGNSSSTGSSSASNGTPSTGSNAVITNPETVHRNRIQSTVAGTSPLEIERLTGATDDLLDFWAEDGTTNLAKVDSTGAATFSALTDTSLTPSQPVRTTTGGLITTGAIGLNTSDVTGVLPVPNGGTGQSSFTDGQLLIGNTSTTGLTKATLASADGTVTITNGHGSIDLSTANGSYRTKIRTVKFYSGGSVIKTFTFNVQETWDSTNSVWIPQWGYALPFEAKTGSTYGWNALFLFHKTGTEHGNVEIVGISGTGVPDYWANAVTQIKRDTSATANQNVYYGVTFPMWSEDNGTWLEQKPLEKGNPARRIYVAGRIFITGSTATPPILLSWVNISDPIFPISSQEILKDSDKDGATPTAPTLVWQPATPSLLIDFGTRLKPVGLQCMAVMANAAGGAAYSVAAMPCRNQVGTANQATIEFSRTTVAAGALVYTPRTDPTAPAGQTETLYVDVWGLLEIIGDDARTQ